MPVICVANGIRFGSGFANASEFHLSPAIQRRKRPSGILCPGPREESLMVMSWVLFIELLCASFLNSAFRIQFGSSSTSPEDKRFDLEFVHPSQSAIDLLRGVTATNTIQLLAGWHKGRRSKTQYLVSDEGMEGRKEEGTEKSTGE